jgi:site-specific DNA recombinase
MPRGALNDANAGLVISKPGREAVAQSVGMHALGDIAIKSFELAQRLTSKWVTADYAAKRRILEILCVKWHLGDVSPDPAKKRALRRCHRRADSQEGRGDRI